jgi:hypothetical protein
MSAAGSQRLNKSPIKPFSRISTDQRLFRKARMNGTWRTLGYTNELRVERMGTLLTTPSVLNCSLLKPNVKSRHHSIHMNVIGKSATLIVHVQIPVAE